MSHYRFAICHWDVLSGGSKAPSCTQHTSLNLSTKIKIVRETRTRTQFASLVTKYNIRCRTLTRIKKEAEELLKRAHKN